MLLVYFLVITSWNSHAVMNGIEHGGKSHERDCVLSHTESFCQCTLIDGDIGVTAGHCLDTYSFGQPIKLTMKSTGEEQLLKLWMVNSERQGLESSGNDVAVFRLWKPIRSEAKMEKIFLPQSNPPVGMSGRVFSGSHSKMEDLSWKYDGTARKSFPIEIRTQYTKSETKYVFDTLDVNGIEPQSLTQTQYLFDQLGIQSTDSENVVCHGDSGGGVTINVNGKEYLAGIVTELHLDHDDYLKAKASGAKLGSLCNFNKNAFGYMESVAYHRKWIENSIKILKAEDGLKIMAAFSARRLNLIRGLFRNQLELLLGFTSPNSSISEEQFKQLNTGFPEGDLKSNGSTAAR
jgi:hypothetical protein